MAVVQSDRLADVVAPGNIVITVPFAVIAGDNEGFAATGTATYTIAITGNAPPPSTVMALLDDIDRLVQQQIAIPS